MASVSAASVSAVVEVVEVVDEERKPNNLSQFDHRMMGCPDGAIIIGDGFAAPTGVNALSPVNTLSPRPKPRPKRNTFL
jgi:hypothetical protein